MTTARHFLKICPLSQLATHTRFTLTLRTKREPITYHRLLLFRLSPLVNIQSNHTAGHHGLYCMESTCPHMGAGLSHAPVTVHSAEEHSSPPLAPPDSGEEKQQGQDELIDRALDLSLEPELEAQSTALHDMEDLVKSGESRTITCPWHNYDFDMITGESEVGMNLCVYKVKVEKLGDEPESVWVQEPVVEGTTRVEEEGNWEVVEVRGVSEEFADPPPSTSTNGGTSVQPATPAPTSTRGQTESSPLPTLPKTLIQASLLILQTSNPEHKVALTRAASDSLRKGTFQSLLPTRKDLNMAKELFDPAPGQGWRATETTIATSSPFGQRQGFTPPREGLQEVNPGAMKRRGKGGNEKSRILMIHALANIEQWAIDLSWDIMARFAHFTVNGERLPVEFYLDWAKVAEDESKHFTLLKARLLSLGSYYGAHTVHAGLWDSALDTQDDLLARLAIIHLVHEARGLDVNPVTIKKFEKAGDIESSKMMEIIHLDEITHVTTGHRWFTWICARMGLDPVEKFRQLVRENFAGKIKGPFSVQERQQAGMSGAWYEDLEGHGFGGNKGQSGQAAQRAEGDGDERVHPRLT